MRVYRKNSARRVFTLIDSYPAAVAGQLSGGSPAFSTYMALYPTYPAPSTVTFCLGAATGGLAAGNHTATQAGIQ